MRMIPPAITHAAHRPGVLAVAAAAAPEAARATQGFASFKNDLKALKKKFPGDPGGADGGRDL